MECSGVINEQLTSELEEIRRRKRIPALGAAAYVNGEVLEIAVTGRRKVGSKTLVNTTDKWHMGSCTKPMTSTLAGILIEQGQIDWNTTVADIFQDWRDEMHDDWHKATLEQLLSHHAGAPHLIPPELWARLVNERECNLSEQRLNFVRNVLSQKPTSKPGRNFVYSNSGYVIAGLMLERCSGRVWEDLMREHIFQPLGMTSAGFGAPGTPNLIDQPYGHYKVFYGTRLSPLEPGPAADNPPAIGPAGTVHCSIQDLLNFAASHAGSSALVNQKNMNRLHRRYRTSEYSPGWHVVKRAWGRGYVLNHNGSNTFWFATMWVAPSINTAFVAVSNAPTGQQGCFEAINGLIARLL
jgi:CubicO group peptidase (beta-lactamase class C family)